MQICLYLSISSQRVAEIPVFQPRSAPFIVCLEAHDSITHVGFVVLVVEQILAAGERTRQFEFNDVNLDESLRLL